MPDLSEHMGHTFIHGLHQPWHGGYSFVLRFSGLLGSDTPLTNFFSFLLDTQRQGSFIVVIVIKTQHAFCKVKLCAVIVGCLFLGFLPGF